MTLLFKSVPIPELFSVYGLFWSVPERAADPREEVNIFYCSNNNSNPSHLFWFWKITADELKNAFCCILASATSVRVHAMRMADPRVNNTALLSIHKRIGWPHIPNPFQIHHKSIANDPKLIRRKCLTHHVGNDWAGATSERPLRYDLKDGWWYTCSRSCFKFCTRLLPWQLSW